MKDGRHVRIAAVSLMVLIAVLGLVHGLAPIDPGVGGAQAAGDRIPSEPQRSADNSDPIPASG